MRWLLVSVAAVVIGTAVYAGSAVVSLNHLVAAARAGNGAEILARTDVPRLKRSLVDQIVSAYLIRTGQDRPIKPLERLVANTYGSTLADVLVAKFLTSENLTAILKKGSLVIDPGTETNMPALGEIDTSNVFSVLRRFSVVKPVEFSVSLGDGDNSGGAISLHFELDGWKLSGVQLPVAAVQALAQNLADSRARKS